MLKVIIYYCLVGLSVALNAVVAFAGVWFIQTRLSKLINERNLNILLIFSAALLLWAGIGKLGWSIQTIGGKTLPERLNQVIFWVLSHFGTFLLFMYIWIKVLRK